MNHWSLQLLSLAPVPSCCSYLCLSWASPRLSVDCCSCCCWQLLSTNTPSTFSFLSVRLTKWTREELRYFWLTCGSWWSSCSSITWLFRSLTIMMSRVSMCQTKVQFTHITNKWNQLFLLALRLVASVTKHLFLLSNLHKKNVAQKGILHQYYILSAAKNKSILYFKYTFISGWQN